MKSLLLTIALLSVSAINADSCEIDASPTVHTSCQEQRAESNDEIFDECDSETSEDFFDDLINSDIPTGMIKQQKPVSPLESYFKQIGVSILLKYIAAKIWLEHQWKTLCGA